jgi:hypothetical protein
MVQRYLHAALGAMFMLDCALLVLVASSLMVTR